MAQYSFDDNNVITGVTEHKRKKTFKSEIDIPVRFNFADRIR